MKTDAQKINEIKNFLKDAKDQIHRAEQVLENIESDTASDDTAAPIVNEEISMEEAVPTETPAPAQEPNITEELPQESTESPVMTEVPSPENNTDHELAQEVLDRPSNNYTEPTQAETPQNLEAPEPISKPTQQSAQPTVDAVDPGVKELDI